MQLNDLAGWDALKRGRPERSDPLDIRGWTVAYRLSIAVVLVIAIGLAVVYGHGTLAFHFSVFGQREQVNILLLVVAVLFSAFTILRSHQTVVRLAESARKAKQAAGRDVLSGLPNRLLFNELVDAEITRCRRKGGQFAIFYIDLDHFKQTNDSFGHDVGDHMIVAVADRISRVLRGSDHIARIGGDEFAILQTDILDSKDCVRFAYRILDVVSTPFELGGQRLFCGLSIGIALYPQNAGERASLMRFADLALYRAKHEGRNRFAFFEAKNGEELRLLQSVEDDLRAAIEDDTLSLLYQPIMSCCGSRLIGVEALVRWQHPTEGLLSAEHFVSLAEERGLIVPLGEWVLRRACSDAKRWPNLRVAVNVSPIQFRQKEFVTTIKSILAETGMEPHRLELELTEGVVISDADLAERAIMDLRALGIRMALDDFGNGYSSLIYLRRFAFDKIKIDRSFLESMEPKGESAIIIASIVQLGHALGLTVTAEGIETIEQANFLLRLGCDESQGFFYSGPLSVDEIDCKYAEAEMAASPALRSIA